MKTRSFPRACRWLNVPSGVLIALLQRSPAVKLVLAAGEYVIASPMGNVLKGVLTAAASLGAVDSLAGATTLSATSASPLSATVGTPVSVAFTVLGTQTPALSWTVSGNFPAGLSVYPDSTGGTGVTTGTVNTPGGTLYLRGSPTASGNFTINVRAWEFAGATGIQSPQFSYIVNVSGSSTAAPTITTDPTSQTVAVGANVTFSVVASGTGLTYQWQKDGSAIAGAMNSSYSITGVQTTAAGNYAAVVTNAGGSVTSRSALLTVTTAGAAPAFTTQPVSQTVAPGGTAVFTVATSSANATYQWQRNGTNMSGATSATLTISGVQSVNSGDYTAVASSTGGSTTSVPATLLVDNPVQGRLTNLSVLNRASATSILTAGFIISGSGSKTLIIRGTGPTLAMPEFKLTGVLPDPQLTLRPLGVNTPIGTNDSWTTLTDPLVASSGLNKLGNTVLDSKDAMLVQSVPAGGYTAQITDATGGSGTALMEVFDTDTTAPGSPGFDAQPRLGNLSALAQVSGSLTAGFIINGTAPVRLVIRATGPTLTTPTFGLSASAVLQNPKVDLKRLSDGKLFASNDNWAEATNSDLAVSGGWNKLGVEAFNSKDAILIVTVVPGAYTATVSDVGGGGGTALVEIFEWPLP